MRAINIQAELNAVPGLTGRTTRMAEADMAQCFGRTFPYRDGLITTVKFSGRSAWERHPADEILYVMDGTGIITEIDDRGYPTPQSLSPGVIAIVAADCWHQLESDTGISLFTVSPQPTEHRR